MEYVTLNNGIKMPKLGYGVYQTPPEDTKRCVLDAIDVGYRSIDTAQAYGNEQGVGDALAECGLPREEFFLTTKVWISNAGYEKAKASIEESLRKLRTDYLDLLLIHQPFGDYYGTYRAMEEFYKAGKIRAIGVSNFGPDRYLDLQRMAALSGQKYGKDYGSLKRHRLFARFSLKEQAPLWHSQCQKGACSLLYGLIFQSAVVAAEGKIVLNLPTQYKLCILQRLIVQ